MLTAGGLSVFRDSGAPEGHANDYTTVIIVHGFVWHGGIFAKLVPIARNRGVRIILLNRRDYPGSKPHTTEERGLLPPISEAPPGDKDAIERGAEALEMFMRQRAFELYKCLQAVVEDRNIPPFRPASKTGGVVLVGWSLGSLFVNALLGYVSSFPVGRIRLVHFIRRVIWQDVPACLLGYPYPTQDPYNPLLDTSLNLEEKAHALMKWLTSYFSHADLDNPDALERRKALRHPSSALARMSNEEGECIMHVPPGSPGGSDWTLLFGCYIYGVFPRLRKRALYPAVADDMGEDWSNIELRHIWGDCTVWEVPYGVIQLRQELAKAEGEGRSVRPVTMVRLRGANHFAHWDHPEHTLDAYLTDKTRLSDSACNVFF
ncbi:hypothetical protein BN946_scf184805.g54 [Trametes cinnabarina]|uniref:AB hydrolase-1 domain-containing protein n=1 Tax=Pycnoporus cinnabarinus TaxID=5643 RepID=A0A060S3I3_PYCCI|nr:hypothetical protein BN946_scf184805.g54 [Trametes cinnabarina]